MSEIEHLKMRLNLLQQSGRLMQLKRDELQTAIELNKTEQAHLRQKIAECELRENPQQQ